MASTTARPLGARLPGKMPTRSPSIRRQPLVSRSMTACDKAGIELAPLMTDTLPPGGLVEAADRAHELATVGEIDVVDAGGDAGLDQPRVRTLEGAGAIDHEVERAELRSLDAIPIEHEDCTAQLRASRSAPGDGRRASIERRLRAQRAAPAASRTRRSRRRSGHGFRGQSTSSNSTLLMDQLPRPPMVELELEQEARARNLPMNDPGYSRAQDRREPDPASCNLEEMWSLTKAIPSLTGSTRSAIPSPRPRYSSSGRPGEALCTVDHLREGARPRVDSGPRDTALDSSSLTLTRAAPRLAGKPRRRPNRRQIWASIQPASGMSILTTSPR